MAVQSKINPKTNRPYTPLEYAQFRTEALNAQIDGFQSAIEDIAGNWKALVHELVGNLRTNEQRAALRQLQFMSVELQKQLNDLGYTNLAQEIVTGYSDSVAYALNTAEIVVGQQLEIPLMDGILKAAQNLDLDAYEFIGTKAIQELSRQLTMDVLVGVSRKNMLKAIDAVIDHTFTAKANQYVDTVTRQFDRTIHSRVATEAGIDTFEYFGPKDTKNRDFCARHVGKVYTSAELKKLDNGMDPPMNNVEIYGGGWRCRHVWVMHVEQDRYPEPPSRTKKREKEASTQGNLFD